MVGLLSGEFTKRKALCKAHQEAVATALAAGRAQASAHCQVSAAGGAADAARHRPGAQHAEVPADDPTAGAADTCGARRMWLSLRARSLSEALACWPESPYPFFSCSEPLPSILFLLPPQTPSYLDTTSCSPTSRILDKLLDQALPHKQEQLFK